MAFVCGRQQRRQRQRKKRSYRMISKHMMVSGWWNHDETLVRDAADVCKKGKTRVSNSKNSCTCGRVRDQCWRLIWVVWDGGYLKGRQTHIKSKLDLRRWNQRLSISQGLKVFQRSQGMQVILAKDDQRILQLHRLVIVWQQYDETKVICFGSVQVRLVGAWEEWFLAGRRKSEESPS